MSDLSPLAREHYEVAKVLAGWFDSGRFRERYLLKFPDRAPGSILPSDYCFNLHNKGNPHHPRFLEWDHDRSYRFVGLDGQGGSSPSAQEAANPPGLPADHPAPVERGSARFLARRDAGLVLVASTAREAVQAFNRDQRVVQQELAAAAVLGKDFEKGRVLQQLRGLDAAYRTRSFGSELVVIAERIEGDFESWMSRVNQVPALVAAGGAFLNAERALLKDRRWTFDEATTLWKPPGS